MRTHYDDLIDQATAYSVKLTESLRKKDTVGIRLYRLGLNTVINEIIEIKKKVRR